MQLMTVVEFIYLFQQVYYSFKSDYYIYRGVNERENEFNKS